MQGYKTSVFVHNMRIHHKLIIVSKEQGNNQVMIFNASYSIKLNPIECLSSFNKHQFVKNCETYVDFKQQEEVKVFVKKRMLVASPERFQKYVNVRMK